MVPGIVAQLLGDFQADISSSIKNLLRVQQYAYGDQGCQILQRVVVDLAISIMTRENKQEMISGFPEGMLTDFANKLALHYLDNTTRWMTMADMLEPLDRDSDLGQGVEHQIDH